MQTKYWLYSFTGRDLEGGMRITSKCISEK